MNCTLYIYYLIHLIVAKCFIQLWSKRLQIFAVIIVTKICTSSIFCEHFLQAYANVDFAKVLEIKNIVGIISKLENTCREIAKLLFHIKSPLLSLITSCSNSFHSSAITTRTHDPWIASPVPYPFCHHIFLVVKGLYNSIELRKAIQLLDVISIEKKCKRDFTNSIHYYTGCGVYPGTTFRGCTEPHSGLTKILSYAEKKIFNKSFYNCKINFLRIHF